MDINADLGEGGGHDAALMPLIARANIACGGHAGDAASMRATLRLAGRHGIAAGAHPSYPDRARFGRTETGADAAQIEADCTRQLVAFRREARRSGLAVAHVKAHGALYHRVMHDAPAADAFLRAVGTVLGGAAVLGLPGSILQARARLTGIGFIAELFADRRYEDNGDLTPRTHPDALIATLDEALAQVIAVRDTGRLRTRTGRMIELQAATVCVHGDGEQAVTLARALHRVLRAPT